MRSLNSWLGFPVSPSHALNEPEPQSSISTISLVQTKISESSIGYDGSSSASGYGISPHTLQQACSEVHHMPMNSDGSLSIMEAFRHTHCEGVSWPSDHTMPVSNDANIQPASMLACDHMLPTCFSTVLEGIRSTDQISNEMQFSIMKEKSEQDGPKLEDFLGGVSLAGGRFSERNTDQTDFENLYYASNHEDISRQKPQLFGEFLQSSFESADRMQAPLQLSEVNEPTHPFQGHSLFSRQEDDDPERSICSDLSNRHPKNLHNLLHERVFDASAVHDNSFFSDYIMQPVILGSSTVGNSSTTGNMSALKTWFGQHQNNVEKTELSSSSSSANDPSKMANNMRTLALTMSPASESSSIVAPQVADCFNSPVDSKRKSIPRINVNDQPMQRKSIDTFGQRSSQYRGVTRHRWTGRYEAHLWDNSSRKEGQTRKGRQVYLGGYDKEEKAARAYDLAALKYWGPTTTINLPLSTYEKELEEMKNMTRLEHVASLRRKSTGFSRGASMYRGVTRHHQQGRWQARIGRVAGNKDLYLGTFITQEEAAEAYDIAAIKFRGVNAVTNFEISRYDLKRICSSHNLVAGHSARLSKETKTATEGSKSNQQIQANSIINLHGSIDQCNPFCKTMQNSWQMVLPVECRDILQQADEWSDQGHCGNYEDHVTIRSYENFLRTASMPGVDAAALSRDSNCSNRMFITTSDHPFMDPLLINSTYSGTSERSRRATSPNEEGNNSKQTLVDYSLHADLENQPYLYLSQQQGSCIKPNSESNMLNSFMTPATMQINPDRQLASAGNMPMFAAWSEN